MNKIPMSVTLITFNEEANLQRAIKSVSWAEEVVVVDSGSTDRTVDIAKSMGAKVFHRDWEGYGKQKNFAQSMTSHDWVLNIDADEEVSAELGRYIHQVLSIKVGGMTKTVGYAIPRMTYYVGRWIRYGGWYPNRQVRFTHKRFSRWTEPEVHEECLVQGSVQEIDAPIYHHSFPSIVSQIQTNLRFSILGSKELLKQGVGPSWIRLVCKPLGKFLECYLIKQGFRDGVAGFIIAVNAAHSMFLKQAYLFEPVIQQQGQEQENKMGSGMG